MCVPWLVLIVGAVFVLVTMLRWFEQTTEAVELKWWNKVFVLLAMPFAVWLFPSKVVAGRPSPVPRHEPVRGFGGVPRGGIAQPGPPEPSAPPATAPDQPPPGTPKEFIGLPKIPPKKPRAPVDPEQVAKLRQKMREQGMLGDE